MRTLAKIIVLVGLLFVASLFAPLKGGLGLISKSVEGQSVIQTYQEGDGKGILSDTEDATLVGKTRAGATPRQEFEADPKNPVLELKRQVSKSEGQTTAETRRIIIRFPNIFGSGDHQIPPGSEIISAALKLTTSSVAWPGQVSIQAHKILEDWSESPPGFLGSPSWRQRHASQSQEQNLWAGPGAEPPLSSAEVPLASDITLPETENAVVAIDVTAALRAWAQGLPNHGLMIRLRDEVEPIFRSATFYSSEWEVRELRPKLEVSYRIEMRGN